MDNTMMSATSPAVLQRITLITDETLEKMMIDQAVKLGADGYICSYCSGKPLHDPVEKPFRPHLLVRIELLAAPEPADAILSYVRNLQGRNYPVTAVVDSVTASP